MCPKCKRPDARCICDAPPEDYSKVGKEQNWCFICAKLIDDHFNGKACTR